MMSETATTAGHIAESLGERIISGALQPDAPLRQDHIACEFNSSHVPVREAFRQLEAQHLIVAASRRSGRAARRQFSEGGRRDACGARSGRAAECRAETDAGASCATRAGADR